MSSFRFLHAADIHLDSPLRGLPDHDGRTAERIRGATRDAFEGLVTQAIDEEVHFVVIAGDLYDGDWRDYQTGLYFVRQMGRLNGAGIPTYVLYGNHDAESSITKKLQLPPNVHSFGHRKPETFLIQGLDVALHGQSFGQKAISDNLAAAYPTPIEGFFNIGVLHTALGGIGGHENYAPCTLGELVNKGYQYWALGHVHKGQVLNAHPHVVFPGNLQGRHIHESGQKGAYLVAVEDARVADIRTIPSDVVRWTQVVVDVGDCSRTVDVHERIRAALEMAVREQADGRLLACRVRIEGKTPLHSELLSARQHLMAETWAAALGLGDQVAWIERVVVDTMPAADATVQAARADAIGELHKILSESHSDEAFRKVVGDDLAQFVARLPAEARRDLEDPILKAALDGDQVGVIRGASEYLLGRLAGLEG